MTCHYPDLGSASDWSCHVGNLIQPIRSTTQIWVVTRHQYGISALVSQTSFRAETSGCVAKCRLFSTQDTLINSERDDRLDLPTVYHFLLKSCDHRGSHNFYYLPKKRRSWLKGLSPVYGQVARNAELCGSAYSCFGRHNFGRDDIRAT